MPTNRRNSSVVCNGIAENRIEHWRRSFREYKRTSMRDMNTLVKQSTVGQANVSADSQQKLLYPFPDDSEFTYEYSNQLVSLNNQYEFVDDELNNIGHGAYGTVFKGKAFDIGRQGFRSVAVKRLAEINVKCHELEAMKRVQNPFLVSLVDICQDENHLHTYIVMELCDVDLDRYLRTQKDGSLSSSEYTLVMQHLAVGYFALFKENIVHRDIKPQNVLLILSPGGNGIQVAKLTDFGVCRVLEDSDVKLSNVAGTLYFMAPEIGANILKTSEYGCSVDIWSLGCVLFQCIAGHLPFNEQELCRLFLHCACSNYYDLTPEFPVATSKTDVALIQGMLATDRSKRLTPEQFYAVALKSMHNKE